MRLWSGSVTFLNIVGNHHRVFDKLMVLFGLTPMFANFFICCEFLKFPLCAKLSR